MAEFLVAEVLFATAATLSFIFIYANYVEISTRPAVRSTYYDLPGPIIGCLLFFNGLIRCFVKPRDEPVWDRPLSLTFLLGVFAAGSTVFFPVLWR